MVDTCPACNTVLSFRVNGSPKVVTCSSCGMSREFSVKVITAAVNLKAKLQGSRIEKVSR